MLSRFLKWKIIVGLIVALVTISAAGINFADGVDGPEEKSLSLEEAVDLALKNNPDIKEAELNIKKAEQEHKGAVKAASNARDMVDKYSATYELGLAMEYNPTAAKVGLELAEKNYDVVKKTVLFNVEKAYYNVLKSEANLAVKREGLNYFKDQLKIAQKAYKVGTKAKVDVTTAEAAVAAYEAQVANEENNRRTAVMELNRLIGMDLDTSLKLTSRFSEEKIGDSLNIESSLKEALADNLEILTVNKELELKNLKHQVSKKYFGAGSTAFEIRALAYEKQIAEEKIRKQEQITESLVKSSYMTIFTQEKMLEWQKKEVEKAKENARVYTLKYENGLATALDVKKATIDLEEAKAGLSETIYNYNLLKSRFKYNLFYAN